MRGCVRRCVRRYWRVGLDGVIGAKAVNRALRSSIEVVRDRRVGVSEGVSGCIKWDQRVC